MSLEGVAILICPGYGHKTHAGCLGWLINNRSLFLRLLEAGGPRSVCQASWLLVRALCQVADGWLLISSNGRGKNGTFIRALIALLRVLPSWPSYLPKASGVNTITLGVSSATYEFGVHKIQTIALVEKRLPLGVSELKMQMRII